MIPDLRSQEGLEAARRLWESRDRPGGTIARDQILEALALIEEYCEALETIEQMCPATSDSWFRVAAQMKQRARAVLYPEKERP